MASTKQTYLLGTVNTVEDNCAKLFLYDGSKLNYRVSLYNIGDMYTRMANNEYSMYYVAELTNTTNNTRIFIYDSKETDSGFDTVIYVSNSGEPLGYTVFGEIQTLSGRRVSITLELRQSNLTTSSGLNISYSVNATESEEKKKYSEILVDSKTAVLSKKDELLPYSSHVSSLDNIFLGDRFVKEKDQDLYRLGIFYGRKLNPYPDTKFTKYDIGYCGGDDIALFSYGNETDRGDTFSIQSLTKTFGNTDVPISYIRMKEGRSILRTLETNEIKNTTLDYIAGRYLVCNVPYLGQRIYDTYQNLWLKSDSGVVIANPKAPGNKIYNLPTTSLLYSDLIQIIPELSRVYLGSYKGQTLSLKKIVGNWYIFQIKSKTINKKWYMICGEGMKLFATSDDNIMFLNDLVLIQKTNTGYWIYKGDGGEEFMTASYKESSGLTSEVEGEWTTKEGWRSSNLAHYRRMYRFPSSLEIIATFGGLIFWMDDENRLYYL